MILLPPIGFMYLCSKFKAAVLSEFKGPDSIVEKLILKFYTLTEAAKELGRSRQSLHELYVRGRLPYERIGNKVMITGGTVEFLKRNLEIRIDKKITGGG